MSKIEPEVWKFEQKYFGITASKIEPEFSNVMARKAAQLTEMCLRHEEKEILKNTSTYALRLLEVSVHNELANRGLK